GIEYWDLEAAKPVGFVPLGLSRENYASFAASKDGRRASCWTKDGKVRFVDLPSGKEAHVMAFPKGGRGLTLSDDGRMIAIDFGNVVTLYRLPDPPKRGDR